MSDKPQKPTVLRKTRKWLRRIGKSLIVTFIGVVVAFYTLSTIFPFPQEKLENLRRQRHSTLVQDRDGRLLRPFLSRDESWLFWVDIDEISPRIIQATVAAEDERFRVHPGVDPIAVVRAAWSNFRQGHIVSGASTLTMQIARLIEPRPRTYSTKIIEAFRALQLERLRTKRQILEIYLNLAPYGGNLVGVEAASLAYFRKHAKDLTLGEAALLSGLVQSPTRLRPDRHPRRAQRRRDHVLKRMFTCGYITKEQLRVALKEPVQVSRSPFSFDAPHFTRMLFQQHSHQTALRTTLDRHIQHVAETALRDRVDALRPQGVTNGSVVVIENATAAVRALVGSCDFFSVEDCGQINGTKAARSPGSALKPFTYALAFDLGIASPSTVLADVPRNFSGYVPENYDRGYQGPVTAREALAKSLNMPAVTLLKKVGTRNLLTLLRECGLTTLSKAPDHYGLALTLGSCETRLLDLTNAYACLARLGIHRPYRLLEDDPPTSARRVFSEGTAYLVADILSDVERPGGECLWKSKWTQVRLAWKTGTSHGHRDAWAFAYTPKYTVGVWIGNFSGKASRALVGVEAAAPVAARIIDHLHSQGSFAWYARPDSVGTRDVCAMTGMPVGKHCPSSVRELHRRNSPPQSPCSVHVLAKIDEQTGQCLCPLCSKGRTYSLRVVENWPGELAAWFRRHGASDGLVPPHFSGCEAIYHDGLQHRILSPSDGQTYILNARQGENQKLLFRAGSSADRLHWFIDNVLYKTCSSSRRLFWPLRKGRHRIACADDDGRSSSIVIHVR